MEEKFDIMLTQTIKVDDNDANSMGSSNFRGSGGRGGRGGRFGRDNYRGNRQWRYQSNRSDKKIYELKDFYL